jgi:hypothetical protein
MNKLRMLAIVATVFVLVLGMQMQAHAIILSGGYVGPVIFHITNYEVGTLYSITSGGSSNVGTGVGLLDNNSTPLSTARFTGTHLGNNNNSTNGTNGNGKEDSWGIFRVDQILANQQNQAVLWDSQTSNVELTGIFWGEQDFNLATTQGRQYIDGVGMHIDMYEDIVKNYDATQGPGVRSGDYTYPTATDGTLVLSLVSVPGFINDTGQYGGLATEFESVFNPGNTTGGGSAWLNITAGRDLAQFDSNVYSAPYITGNVADVQIAYQLQAGANGWLVRSTDPVYADALPEPATLIVWSLLGLTGGGLMAWRRRNGAESNSGRTHWSEETRAAIHQIIERGSSRS